MECKISKDKIREGIVNTITSKVQGTGLFSIEGNTVTALAKIPDSVELSDDHKPLIDKALTYSNDLDGMYKQMFESDPGEFLRYIAQQANSSSSEMSGALGVAGPNILDIALELFPNEGKMAEETQAIEAINKEFGEDILLKAGINQWQIFPTDELALRYMMAQEGAGDLVVAEIRSRYLQQFSSTSSNLLGDDLWLGHPILQDPTIERLLAFARKLNPDFRIEVVEDLDVNAVALIRDNIIFIRQGSIIDDLPEEISHFFFELLPTDHPLRKEMMAKIVDMPIYSQTYQQYKNSAAYQKNGKPDIDKIKREAVAKQIGEYIKAAYRGEADEKYGKKRSWLKQIIHDIMKWLRKSFQTIASPIFREPIVDVRSPFQDAADQVLKADMTSMNLEAIPTLYDSVFFSAIEDEMAEGYEASTVVKNLHQFSQTLKRQISRTFFTYIQRNNMTAIAEQLQDPTAQNYNKIWDIIGQLDLTTSTLQKMMDSDTIDQLAMYRVAAQLAQAYHEMEEIPAAIERVIKKMKTNKDEDSILNSVSELQSYMQFADAFQNITNEYVGMLTYLQKAYGAEDVNHIYDTMIEKMGNTDLAFRAVDGRIMDMLQEYVINLTDVWTEKAFEKYTSEREAEIARATTTSIKKKINDELRTRITSIKQIRQAVTGNFPDGKKLTLPDGSKVDISRIKDASQIDYIVFLFSSPTLVADPFISGIMAHYTDKYVAGKIKGFRESKVVADSILPLKVDLAESGIGWYEAERSIQNVQTFYDNSKEDKKVEKRVFLSATNRFDFQYQKQLKLQELTDASRTVENLQKEYNEKALTQDEKDALRPKLEEAIKDRAGKREVYNKWIGDWSYRPFTDEYYKKIDALKEGKADSEVLKKIKGINRQLQDLEEQLYVLVVVQGRTENKSDFHFDAISSQIAELQDDKRRLSELLPATEQSVFDAMEDIYEIDEVATARYRQRHKNQWIKSLVSALLEKGETNYTRSELEKIAENDYNYIYNIIRPTEAFYDKRSAIFDQIANVTAPEVGLQELNSYMKELVEKQKKLLKPFRDLRSEINITSFKYLSIENYPNGEPKLLSQSLKELEEEIDWTRQRITLYSRIIASTADADHKQAMMSYVEMMSAFGRVIKNEIDYKAEDVQRIFANIMPLTISDSERILSAIRKGNAGDNSEFQSLTNIVPPTTSNAYKYAFSLLKFDSPVEFTNIEQSVYDVFKGLGKLETEENVQRAALYSMLEEMYSKGMSMQYYIAMREFNDYLSQYLNDDSFLDDDKDLHKDKAGEAGLKQLHTITDLEDLYGDGLFDSVIKYMEYVERNQVNPTSAYPLADLIDFYKSIHKKKITWIDGEQYTTYTPISYIRTVSPNDPDMYTEQPPRFLQRNKVKDSYRTEKIYETDPRVRAGQVEPTVDLNGQWLPLPKKDSPFFNQEYDRMSKSSDAIDKKKMAFLNKLKNDYLDKQEEYLPEGERLDLVIPAKYTDKYEQKEIYLKDAKAAWEYIKNINPLSNKDNTVEEQDYKEDIGAITVENRDIYTGAVISEGGVKMHTRRGIPLKRTSVDATSSVMLFIEDVNEYSSKNMVAPVMKTFSEVFKRSHERNNYANKNRKGILTDLYLTKVLDEIPKNFANNPQIVKMLAVINKLTTMRLLGDPLGALVNLTSGSIQNLIEASVSVEAARMYIKTQNMANDWLLKFEQDFHRQTNWRKETQIVHAFNMMPDGLELSKQLSKANIYANIRAKLMYPRSITEKQMAIQLGLSIAMTEKIVHNGNSVTINDIYEIDPITGLLRIKDEYKSLQDDWNPVDGKKVIAIRRKIIQFYTLQQGNFFKQNQSYISTMAVGKMGELMKRWFASGVIRRFQGEVMDPMTGDTRKGYHLAMIHAIGNYMGRVFNGDMKGANEYWNIIAKRPSEKLALRKSLAEMFYVFVFAFIATAVLGYDDDDEDKNEKLRESEYWKQLALLVALRVQGELGTFIPLPVWGLGYMEMKRAILDPIGLPKTTVDNVMGIGKLGLEHILQLFGADYNRDLYYQKGKPYGYNAWGLGAFKDKDDSKFMALILNTIGYTGYTFEPAEYIKTLTQMQNRIK